MEKSTKIIIACLILSILLEVIAIVNQITILKNQETYKMFYEQKYQIKYNKDTAGFDGLYYPSQDYYCVWVKDRTQTQIVETDYHENCHALIDSNIKQEQHFCGDIQ